MDSLSNELVALILGELPSARDALVLRCTARFLHTFSATPDALSYCKGLAHKMYLDDPLEYAATWSTVLGSACTSLTVFLRDYSLRNLRHHMLILRDVLMHTPKLNVLALHVECSGAELNAMLSGLSLCPRLVDLRANLQQRVRNARAIVNTSAADMHTLNVLCPNLAEATLTKFPHPPIEWYSGFASLKSLETSGEQLTSAKLQLIFETCLSLDSLECICGGLAPDVATLPSGVVAARLRSLSITEVYDVATAALVRLIEALPALTDLNLWCSRLIPNEPQSYVAVVVAAAAAQALRVGGQARLGLWRCQGPH